MHFLPRLFVTVVCVIGLGSFNVYICVCVCVCVYIYIYIYICRHQRGCAVKTTLDVVFYILFLLEEPVELVLEV